MVAQVKKCSTKRLCLTYPLVLRRTRITLMCLRTKTAYTLTLVLPLIRLAVAIRLDLDLALPPLSTHPRAQIGSPPRINDLPVGAYKLDEDTTNRALGWLQQVSLTALDENAIDSAATQPEHEHSNNDPHPQQDAPNLLDALPLTKEVDSPPAEDAVDGDRDLPAPWRTRKSDENPASLIENGRKSVQYARNVGAGGSSGTDTK
ncbi:hypothetical protein BKA70DRAFT_1419380 [Coprinopsis sp. MPI-PUGE-AT-0042]|nr:hypothetical protein BKA70DRAFT_1419380 [Coprinopsis sp. MPI-PUGE-AT-0042]